MRLKLVLDTAARTRSYVVVGGGVGGDAPDWADADEASGDGDDDIAVGCGSN